MIRWAHIVRSDGNVRSVSFHEPSRNDPPAVASMHARTPPINSVDWQVGPDELVFFDAVPTADQFIAAFQSANITPTAPAPVISS